MEHLEKREPLSLIRLGDGEGAILGFPEQVEIKDDHLDHILYFWLGRPPAASAKQVEAIKKPLKDAIAAADIIGLPPPGMQHPNQRYFSLARDYVLNQADNPATRFCSAWIHHLLQYGLLFAPLLEKRDFLGLISPRFMVGRLTQVFGVTGIYAIPIPAELQHKNLLNAHFRHADMVEDIRKNLVVPYRGALFLVAAGVFGKTYCQWIKEKGGIAIDIGSVPDGWAGISSRPYMNAFPEIFGLDVYMRHKQLEMNQRLERIEKVQETLKEYQRLKERHA